MLGMFRLSVRIRICHMRKMSGSMDSVELEVCDPSLCCHGECWLDSLGVAAPRSICYVQARSQGTFEVEALLGRGFGGRLEALIGSRAKPWWGLMGRSPPEANGFYTFTVHFYVKNDLLNLLNIWLHNFTCNTIALEGNWFYTFTVQFSIRQKCPFVQFLAMIFLLLI